MQLQQRRQTGCWFVVLLAVNVKEDGIIAIREIPRRKTELSAQK